MKQRWLALLFSGVLPIALAPPPPPLSPTSSRMSVLMLVVDDLRADLLDRDGHDNLRTPALDRLAHRGLRFTRAYAQYPLCSPSRSSVLTGTRPDTTRVHDLNTHFRRYLPTAVTLPQAFKAAGYLTVGAGKVFHRGFGDSAASWSEPPPDVNRPAYARPENLEIDLGRKAASRADHALKAGPGSAVLRGGKVARGPYCEVSPPNATFHDDAVAVFAVAALAAAAPAARAAYFGRPEKEDGAAAAAGAAPPPPLVEPRPFFIAAGFVRPHLPWVAPRPFWNRFAEADGGAGPASGPPATADKDLGGEEEEGGGAPRSPVVVVGPPRNPVPPRRLPSYVVQQGGAAELKSYHGLPDDLDTLLVAHKTAGAGGGGPGGTDSAAAGAAASATGAGLRRAYAASAAFADHQLGRVLGALDAHGLAGCTIVVVWGDHGFKLGEHGTWGKNANTEVDTRVPFVVALPAHPAPFPRRSSALGGGGGGGGQPLTRGAETVVAAAAAAAAGAHASHPAASVGVASAALVELVDIYPTLLDLCGLLPGHADAPRDSHHPLEGSSFAALLLNRSLALSAGGRADVDGDGEDTGGGEGGRGVPLPSPPPTAWKRAAFSQVTRKRIVTGYSLRTPRFRYTVWVDIRKAPLHTPPALAPPPAAPGGAAAAAAAGWEDSEAGRESQSSSSSAAAAAAARAAARATDVAGASAARAAADAHRRLFRSAKTVELYDLERDPDEADNLAGKAQWRRCEAALRELWRSGFCAAATGGAGAAPRPAVCGGQGVGVAVAGGPLGVGAARG